MDRRKVDDTQYHAIIDKLDGLTANQNRIHEQLGMVREMVHSVSQRQALGEQMFNARVVELFGGDGERGKIGDLRQRVRALENWRIWLVGVASAIGTGVGLFWAYIRERFTGG